MLCRNIGIIQHGELVENTSMKNLLSKLKSETFHSRSGGPKARCRSWKAISTGWLIRQRWKWKFCASQGINSVFSQLSQQGIQVLSMRNKANRLEELFVSLVHEKQGDQA
ncbi:Uncharacterised protein [Leclercia adecarboxylata]|uniref:Daunorubicin/doxorubicin resistance ATP-binding protein DrrA n=1 Tax=Leclercia adecarboxylata TaxID=83655 RepID=A0A4V6JHH2_9ENTR|nr:Uncharacterised protein [Leclercia adecarboxylata]